MQFLYNPRKAAQAAAYLVNLNSGQMDMLSLLKILYLADRKSLSERGRPISGDAMVSMPHGPVLSRIYDSMKCGPEEGQVSVWDEYLIEQENRTARLRQADPPTEELSQFEREILERTLAQYGAFGARELGALTRSLPEYRDPQGSVLPIDPATILKAEGWTDEEIHDAAVSAREEIFLSAVGK